MASEDEAWAQMAGTGGNTAMAPATAPSAAPPPPPAAAAAPEASGGKRRKKEKMPKAAKEPRAPKRSRSAGSNGGDWSLTFDEGPSRQELEQQAAAELFAALAPSYDLLHAEVPDAASPEDAQRKIESQLGPAPRDNDADLPGHPIWQGDALVYQQLKRHYGKPHQGSSFQRSWIGPG